MAAGKKKFEACLLRTSTDELIVAEWNQLSTTGDMSKLGVGASVGYRKSSNKREKPIRGKILVVGSARACAQQLKVFKKSADKRKLRERESSAESEEETDGPPSSKSSSRRSQDESSESTNDALHIDPEEETSTDSTSIPVRAREPQSSGKENTSVKQQSNNTEQDTSDEEGCTNEMYSIAIGSFSNGLEAAVVVHSLKRSSSEADAECSTAKRSSMSLARFDELRMENTRLKKQAEKYRQEWMPRPTDPAVVAYFVRMGQLFSSNGDDEDENERRLENVCSKLDMNEDQLRRLQKPNGTKTARSIVRACYPPSVRTSVTQEDLTPDFRQAVHDYVALFHGMECLTEGKINESINNVFRSAKSQQKEKATKRQPEQTTVSKKTCISSGKENRDSRDR